MEQEQLLVLVCVCDVVAGFLLVSSGPSLLISLGSVIEVSSDQRFICQLLKFTADPQSSGSSSSTKRVCRLVLPLVPSGSSSPPPPRSADWILSSPATTLLLLLVHDDDAVSVYLMFHHKNLHNLHRSTPRRLELIASLHPPVQSSALVG